MTKKLRIENQQKTYERDEEDWDLSTDLINEIDYKSKKKEKPTRVSLTESLYKWMKS